MELYALGNSLCRLLIWTQALPSFALITVFQNLKVQQYCYVQMATRYLWFLNVSEPVLLSISELETISIGYHKSSKSQNPRYFRDKS